MPVERYTVGRIGTEREHAKADFADPGAVRTVLEEMTSRDFTVEGRVAELERAARAYLQRQGVPDDLNTPCYADPAWLRKNERWSLVWYSIEILRNANWLGRMIERGDTRLAADFALDLGMLATEAKFIQMRTGKQGQGGRATREEIAQRNAAWSKQAKEIRKRHPAWGKSDVIRLIARDSGSPFETVKSALKKSW